MPFFWIPFGWVILLLIVVGPFLLLSGRWGAPGGPQRGHGPDPMAILQERFARGEIDHDEYERSSRVLDGR